MIQEINLQPGKKVYFASDFHLGVPNETESKAREKRVIEWLRTCEADAQVIFLMGDIFDFWFEYSYVVPKGFIRIQAEIARLVERGIPVYWFTGNHDMWIFSYFEKELGVTMVRKPIQITIGSKKFYLGHGDGLGPGDYFYKFLKKIFANPFFQFWFRITPASIGIGIAHKWSKHSRVQGLKKEKYLGEGEWLFQYCREIQQTQSHDYYIFGHRHLPLDLTLPNSTSRYINLGEWVHYDSYAVFDGQQVTLEYFKP